MSTQKKDLEVQTINYGDLNACIIEHVIGKAIKKDEEKLEEKKKEEWRPGLYY